MCLIALAHSIFILWNYPFLNIRTVFPWWLIHWKGMETLESYVRMKAQKPKHWFCIISVGNAGHHCCKSRPRICWVLWAIRNWSRTFGHFWFIQVMILNICSDWRQGLVWFNAKSCLCCVASPPKVLEWLERKQIKDKKKKHTWRSSFLRTRIYECVLVSTNMSIHNYSCWMLNGIMNYTWYFHT